MNIDRQLLALIMLAKLISDLEAEKVGLHRDKVITPRQ
jgi:hypothetical protein